MAANGIAVLCTAFSDEAFQLLRRWIKDPEFEIELKADPQPGDPQGTASCFAGVDKRFGKEQEFGGTISAEHGIGRLKRDLLPYAKGKAEMELMRKIKQAFDPNFILNPGKLL